MFGPGVLQSPDATRRADRSRSGAIVTAESLVFTVTNISSSLISFLGDTGYVELPAGDKVYIIRTPQQLKEMTDLARLQAEGKATVLLVDLRPIHALEYANTAAREAAAVVFADIGKVARQTDNETLWSLQSVSPAVWEPLFHGGAKAFAALIGGGAVGANFVGEAGNDITVGYLSRNSASLQWSSTKRRLTVRVNPGVTTAQNVADLFAQLSSAVPLELHTVPTNPSQVITEGMLGTHLPTQARLTTSFGTVLTANQGETTSEGVEGNTFTLTLYDTGPGGGVQPSENTPDFLVGVEVGVSTVAQFEAAVSTFFNISVLTPSATPGYVFQVADMNSFNFTGGVDGIADSLDGGVDDALTRNMRVDTFPSMGPVWDADSLRVAMKPIATANRWAYVEAGDHSPRLVGLRFRVKTTAYLGAAGNGAFTVALRVLPPGNGITLNTVGGYNIDFSPGEASIQDLLNLFIGDQFFSADTDRRWGTGFVGGASEVMLEAADAFAAQPTAYGVDPADVLVNVLTALLGNVTTLNVSALAEFAATGLARFRDGSYIEFVAPAAAGTSRIYAGVGNPAVNGTPVIQGSLYLRMDGGVGSTLYSCTATTWEPAGASPIVMAANVTEETAAFTAGKQMVIRTDLL